HCLALAQGGLERTPRAVELLSYRKEVLAKLGRHDEAAEAALALADELVATSKEERAEAALTESLKDTRHPQVLERLVMLLIKGGRVTEATDRLLDAASWIAHEPYLAQAVDLARAVLKAAP